MTHVLFSLLLGSFAGLAAGILGVGGGMIVVPGLAALFAASSIPHALTMHLAIGTSLAAMIFITGTAVITQQRLGNIQWQLFRHLAPGMVIGTLLGTTTTSFLPTYPLKIIFALFCIIMALKMWITKPMPSDREVPKPFVQNLFGVLIGFLSGLLGVGGAAITVPLLIRLGVSSHKATATSSACACLLAIVGTISFLIASRNVDLALPGVTGFIDWRAAVSIAVASLLFVPLGAKIAQKFSEKTLERTFAIFLLAIAAEILFY